MNSLLAIATLGAMLALCNLTGRLTGNNTNRSASEANTTSQENSSTDSAPASNPAQTSNPAPGNSSFAAVPNNSPSGSTAANSGFPQSSPAASTSDTLNSFSSGTYTGYAHNTTVNQRASLSLVLTRSGDSVTGSAFVGPPLRGSGTVSGTVSGDVLHMSLKSQDTHPQWIIALTGKRTADGGIEGDYTVSNGQRGVFRVSPGG
jgi:hypothetical protein